MLSRRTILAMFPGLAVLGTQAATTEPPNDTDKPEVDIPVDGGPTWSSWQDYDRAMGDIAKLPDWPAQRNFRKEEWEDYIAVALAWQRSRRCNIEALLLIAMLNSDWFEPSDVLINHWSDAINDERRLGSFEEQIGTRIMILLRIMFEVPADANSNWIEEADYPIGACGGFLNNAFTPEANGPDAPVMSPVDWNDEGPKLIAGSRLGEPGGVWTDYHPNFEFRYLSKHFQHRANLEKFLPEDVFVPWALH